MLNDGESGMSVSVAGSSFRMYSSTSGGSLEISDRQTTFVPFASWDVPSSVKA